MNKISAADLFCGAGGTSTGLLNACQELGYDLDLLAINHWDVAIATHSANHHYAQHICETLDNVNPRKVVPKGRLDILIASPECTHHSNARGGKPRSDQSRASAWHICRWAEALRIDNILIENVREFQNWGPLGYNNLPLKSRKGETFHAFLKSIASLGYRVEYRILNAAHYGDPTTRERLFIIARRGNRKITWPDPTHGPVAKEGLKQWCTAREIIDWSISGQSIFDRKKPLSQNTMNRIFAGLQKFSGPELQPFLVMLYKSNDARSINRPMPTVTAQGGHIGVCEPFLVQYNNHSKPQSVKRPLRTQSTKDRFALCEPFIVQFNRNSKPASINNPLPAQTTKEHFGVCRPFIVPNFTERKGQKTRCHSTDKPLPTITGHGAGALVQPFLVGITQTGGNGKRIRSIDDPIPTICTKEEFALCTPFVIGQQSCAAPRSVDNPIPTVAGAGAIALVQPQINGQRLDIHFRMLKPHELARAMSFGDDYKFEGNREAQVKQIGNAVPVKMAEALCRQLLN